jgi:serine/threonine-protein kinase
VPTEPIALHLLGGAELKGIGREEADGILVQPKLVALLAYLLLAGADGRYQRRDQLIGLLWPELDQAHARTALRKAMYFIRAVLGPALLVSRGDEEIAIPAGTLACDVIEFRNAIDTGRLARAMECYRDDLLPGFHLNDCAEFERWLDAERLDLRERAAAAALAFAEMFERDKSMTIASKWARQALRFSWDNERVLRRAMSLLDRANDRSGALRMYTEFAARLKKELDAEPSPETVELARRLRG